MNFHIKKKWFYWSKNLARYEFENNFVEQSFIEIIRTFKLIV